MQLICNKMNALNKKEVQNRMLTIDPSWKLDGEFICRNFLFKDFAEAFAFMTKVAVFSEKLNHHPNWENVFNKVKIAISTHEINGLTERDFELALEIDKILC